MPPKVTKQRFADDVPAPSPKKSKNRKMPIKTSKESAADSDEDTDDEKEEGTFTNKVTIAAVCVMLAIIGGAVAYFMLK